MKKILILTSLALTVLLASCSASQSGYTVYDDVYYRASDPKPAAAPAVTQDEARYTTTDPDYSVKAEPKGVDYNDPDYAGYDEDLYYENNTFPSKEGQSGEYNSSSYASPDVNTYVTNNYYDGGDYGDNYYDYAYSSRIRRFHNPAFYDYYHGYYTNMYWYTHDPYYYGTSIYMGYNYWDPYYSYGWPRFRLGYSWGWGGLYYNWPMYSYSPFYGYGSPYWGYNSYYQGYNHGYWDGYNSGHYSSYYYNSYDYNSHYGPRNNRGSSSGTSPDGRPPRSLGERYENAMASQGVRTGRTAFMERYEDADRKAGRDVRPAADSRESNQHRGSANTSETGDVRTMQSRQAETNAQGVANPGRESNEVRKQETTATDRQQTTPSRQTNRVETQTRNASSQGEAAKNTDEVRPPSRSDADNYSNSNRYNYRPNTQREDPANKYNRPDPAVYQRYEKPKVYTSPTYTRPQSSQEYTSPGSRTPQNYARPENATPQRTRPDYTRPAEPQYQKPNRTYSPPSRSNESSAPRYTPPSRSENNSSSTPNRTYSSPNRSSGSYSAPARSSSRSSSSGSSVTPSRSSSSSSSSSSRSSSSKSSSGSSGSSRGGRR